MKSYLFFVVILLCSSICSFFCTFATLHSAGFCVREMRWLSVAEKKFIAAKIVSDGKYRPIVFYSVSPVFYSDNPDYIIRERNTLIPYNNVLKFLQKNPGCCTVIPEEEVFGDHEPITFWDRFWGGYSYGVVVKSLTTEKSSINGGPEVTETSPSAIYLKFNNCGKCRMKDSYPY